MERRVIFILSGAVLNHTWSVVIMIINPLWICRNKLKGDCHSGFCCLLCKQCFKVINNLK